jgi:hypothetical protein
MEIEYEKVGDYYLPKLAIEKQNKNVKLGKYAYLRLDYLKQHKKGLYTALKMKNELTNHLLEIQTNANTTLENLTKELAEKEGITEELKAKNQLEWVGKMNNIKAQSEEIILKELIYI